MIRGYFGIGIENTKTKHNIGTLWRSAYNFGAEFVFTVGKRYGKQHSDTQKTWRHIPLFHYADFDDLYDHLPYNCQLIGVEIDERAKPIQSYEHPQRGVYLLGAEDHGLTKEAVSRCHDLLVLPSVSDQSMNVAVAGSLVMYDRYCKTISESHS